MSVRVLFSHLTRILLFTAFISTTYLYLLPFWHGCAFPSTNHSTFDGFVDTLSGRLGQTSQNTATAPFRLLVLADPQLEGDSSLPKPEDALGARLKVYKQRLVGTGLSSITHNLNEVVNELIYTDIPRSLEAVRKTIDLWGNDFYLAHIYRTLNWWAVPTHVTVLGDLLGSQWVSDGEFSWRSWRYWNRVLAGTGKVAQEVMSMHRKDISEQVKYPITDTTRDWRHQVINIVGNHDIGYSGDIDQPKIDRFEREFGDVNWDIHLTYPASYQDENNNTVTPTLHLIVFNSMTLDGPAKMPDLQSSTIGWLNELIGQRLIPVEQRNNSFTLFLTHVPLHKAAGICVDAPFFDYWPDQAVIGGEYLPQGLKEQNHLSEGISRNILSNIFGMSGNHDAAIGGKGRHGLILNGHDHEGCDVVHYIERDQDEGSANWSWKTNHTSNYKSGQAGTHTSLREITLRSMMGSFGGNAGLLSLWYDFDAKTWDYKMVMCPFGIQHIWWAVHVVDSLAFVVLVVNVGLMVSDQRSRTKKEAANKTTKIE